MRSTLALLVVTSFFVACDKPGNTDTDTLAPEDIAAVSNMKSSLTSMESALNNLQVATSNSDRQYWDRQFHIHDSTFWVHHNNYHHETYAHDDHSHQWVAYDPSINHHGHHHPHYPGHLNDSLIVVTNNHHHINCDHHPGHHICHHHHIRQLHHHHQQIHP